MSHSFNYRSRWRLSFRMWLALFATVGAGSLCADAKADEVENALHKVYLLIHEEIAFAVSANWPGYTQLPYNHGWPQWEYRLQRWARDNRAWVYRWAAQIHRGVTAVFTVPKMLQIVEAMPNAPEDRKKARRLAEALTQAGRHVVDRLVSDASLYTSYGAPELYSSCASSFSHTLWKSVMQPGMFQLRELMAEILAPPAAEAAPPCPPTLYEAGGGI